MSTQALSSHTVIPISHANVQSGVRLLELPPELLQLVDSGITPQLTFKSPPANSSDGSPAHTVLCTDERTYEIKQVQTSNTVMVMRPQQSRSETSNRDDEVDMDEDENEGKSASEGADWGMEAFAMCGSTLEVLPIKPGPKVKTAAQWLKTLLPAWRGPESASLDQRGGTGDEQKGKQDYTHDVPYSNVELDVAWKALMVFETRGKCWRPTEGALLDLWKGLTRSLDVTGTLDSGDLEAVLGQEDCPKELAEALRNALTKETKGKSTLEFDKDSTLSWLAVNYLEANPQTDITDSKELIPPEWQEEDAEAQLKACAATTVDAGDGAALPIKDAATTPSKDSGPKRIGKSTNWHDKFKRAKR